jgi:hypothetical protein
VTLVLSLDLWRTPDLIPGMLATIPFHTICLLICHINEEKNKMGRKTD